MGMAGCFYWIVGTASVGSTAPTGAVLDATTKIQGSPYALFAIFAFGVTATWIVSNVVHGIRDEVKVNRDEGKKAWRDVMEKISALSVKIESMDDKREETEKQLVAIKTHVDECPHNGRHK